MLQIFFFVELGVVYFCIAFLGGLVTHKYSIELTLRAFMIRKKMALKSLCCINNSAEILILFTSTNRSVDDSCGGMGK